MTETDPRDRGGEIALAFASDRLRLLGRAGPDAPWRALADADLSAPDVARRAGALAAEGARFAPGARATIVLPADHVLIEQLPAADESPDEARRRFEAGLGVRAAGLEIAYLATSDAKAGFRVAAAERTTIDEAVAYARAWGFIPGAVVPPQADAELPAPGTPVLRAAPAETPPAGADDAAQQAENFADAKGLSPAAGAPSRKPSLQRPSSGGRGFRPALAAALLAVAGGAALAIGWTAGVPDPRTATLEAPAASDPSASSASLNAAAPSDFGPPGRPPVTTGAETFIDAPSEESIEPAADLSRASLARAGRSGSFDSATSAGPAAAVSPAAAPSPSIFAESDALRAPEADAPPLIVAEAPIAAPAPAAADRIGPPPSLEQAAPPVLREAGENLAGSAPAPQAAEAAAVEDGIAGGGPVPAEPLPSPDATALAAAPADFDGAAQAETAAETTGEPADAAADEAGENAPTAAAPDASAGEAAASEDALPAGPPPPRGATPVARPEAVAAASARAIASALATKPTPRPAALARPPAGRFAEGRRPPAGSGPAVSRAATMQDALPATGPNLIGVFGAPKKRRALVRDAAGELRRVVTGDKLDGWTIGSIDGDSVQLRRSGLKETLRLPSY